MYAGYKITYVIFSFLIFFYALSSRKRCIYAFSLAIAVNIFPVMFAPNIIQGAARLGGIPIAYMPIASAGLAMIIMSRFRFCKDDTLWACLALTFMLYITITSFREGITGSVLSYYMAWPFNFILFLSARYYFSKVDIKICEKVLKHLFILITVGAVIGLLRYSSGLAENANFMPMMYRNGTVVFIVMMAPLLFFLRDRKVLSFSGALLAWCLLFVTLFYIQSRAGLIGFVFATLLYYFRINIRSLATFALIATLFFTTIYFDLLAPGDGKLRITERLKSIPISISSIINEGYIPPRAYDERRFWLMVAATDIIKANFWLGTGIGAENYKRAFEKHVKRPMKGIQQAHIFYFTYFAKLGLIGFTLLILILAGIYRKLAVMSGRYRAFRISFITMSLMMTMNEFIHLPELWFFYGVLAGVSMADKQERSLDLTAEGRSTIVIGSEASAST